MPNVRAAELNLVSQSSTNSDRKSRRAHAKSRSGCLQCKQRRVKCDEHKPECKKCNFRDSVCTYPSSVPLKWVGDKAAASTTNGEARADSDEAPFSLAYSANAPPNESQSLAADSVAAVLNLQNIDLIIHWFTTTVHTVIGSTNPVALKICQTVILDHARKHHFLLHGLLALSALHLADSHVDAQKYTRIATTHHTQGLALFHSILADINENNYAASIAFSSLTVMFAFAFSRPPQGVEIVIGLIDDLAQIFLLLEGWHKVVHVANNLEGISPPIGATSSSDRSNGSLPADIQATFAHLLALNTGHNTELYREAITSLSSAFRRLEDEGATNPDVALVWPNMIPDGFVRLLERREPLALVIVAHYCVVLERVPPVWWLSGWSKGLLRVICQYIEPAYQRALEWPRAMVSIDG